MNPRHNLALGQLGQTQIQHIHRHLQLVSLSPGQVLFGPGDRIDCAWFPVNALVAVAHELEEGLSMDMALIGRDSVIGLRGLASPFAPTGCMWRTPDWPTGLRWPCCDKTARRANG